MQSRTGLGPRREEPMAYTVKQLAAMSGVSVRTLHFYDETGLLKPAYHGSNGYRFYEELQLLMLQQILFYRELGFELKEIKRILGRADFEKVDALQSHREVLRERLDRTRTLMDTIDKTIMHLKGAKKMASEEMFAGFSVGAGKGRFDEHITIAGEPADCKVSARDTDGAMCVFEFTSTGSGPRHRHQNQDEWIYVVDGELDVEIGQERFRVGGGESVFVPRKVAHGWASASHRPVKIINVYQPAGKMEDFFRELAKYEGKQPVHEALSYDEFCRMFQAHGMDVAGPPLLGEWKVDESGRIVQIA